MNSIIGKKRVSFDMNINNIHKIDVVAKELYTTVLKPGSEIPIRVRSDIENEMHTKKYIGIMKDKN